jgi:hypothetical protein
MRAGPCGPALRTGLADRPRGRGAALCTGTSRRGCGGTASAIRLSAREYRRLGPVTGPAPCGASCRVPKTVELTPYGAPRSHVCPGQLSGGTSRAIFHAGSTKIFEGNRLSSPSAVVDPPRLPTGMLPRSRNRGARTSARWQRRPRSHTRTPEHRERTRSPREGGKNDLIGNDRIDGRACTCASSACNSRACGRSDLRIPPVLRGRVNHLPESGPGCKAIPAARRAFLPALRSQGSKSGGQPSRPGMIRLTFRTTSGSKRTRYALFTTGGESARQGVRGCRSRFRAVTRPEPDPWPRRGPGARRRPDNGGRSAGAGTAGLIAGADERRQERCGREPAQRARMIARCVGHGPITASDKRGARRRSRPSTRRRLRG